MATTADSVETLVLVLRLLNMRATFLPEREPASSADSDEPDLRACLCFDAFFTRATSSFELKSAIDRKWRGAKGEVAGVDVEDWHLI